MNKISYIIATGLLFLFIASAFIIDQRQYAIIFQFGEAVKVVKEPGLHFKLPFLQNVEYFDNRILNVSLEAQEVTASDEKRIIVDAFAKYQIIDPVQFFKTVNNVNNIKVRLNRVLESSLRKAVGTIPLITLLSHERQDVMKKINDYVNEETKRFGVSIIDVRILRADLPKENSDAIYQRMQTEREKEAKQIRAEGFEIANKIKAEADKQSKIILAESYKKSETLKGEGDSEATKVFNSAYGSDPEFFKFYKSLHAYQSGLKGKDTSFIISPDSEFLKFLRLNKSKVAE